MDMSQLYMLMNLYQMNQAAAVYGGNASSGLRSAGYLSGNTSVTGLSSFRQVLENTAQTSGGVTTPMDDIFEEASKATGVDVRLLKAVAKAESNFDASATSWCGAMGVMQLMPATAASLGVTNAYDARENIMAGARLLASHLEKYNGDVSLALAAYNAGSGSVDKYGGIPPFTETQNYVAKVLEYAGDDISTGQTVSAASSELSGSEELLSGLEDLDYSELCRLMIEQMRLQMDQKLASILSLSSDSEDEEDENSLFL